MGRAMQQVADRCNGLWDPQLKSADNLFQSEIEKDNAWIVSVDGRQMKRLPFHHEGIVKGDTFSLAIAMGSLIAKVTRDRKMKELAEEFPFYDFSSNKGYGSPKHLSALEVIGLNSSSSAFFVKKYCAPLTIREKRLKTCKVS